MNFFPTARISKLMFIISYLFIHIMNRIERINFRIRMITKSIKGIVCAVFHSKLCIVIKPCCKFHSANLHPVIAIFNQYCFRSFKQICIVSCTFVHIFIRQNNALGKIRKVWLIIKLKKSRCACRSIQFIYNRLCISAIRLNRFRSFRHQSVARCAYSVNRLSNAILGLINPC